MVNKDEYIMPFAIMMNKDTCCDDSVVTCSNIVVITAYIMCMCIFLLKLV